MLARCASRSAAPRVAPRASATPRVRLPSSSLSAPRTPARSYAAGAAAPASGKGSQASGAQPVPKGYAHATGPEKVQLTMQFYHGHTVFEGQFGTLDHPLIVESQFEHRTVGCEGGPTADDEHEILWHNVYENKPTICVECGQVFALKRLDVMEQEENSHPVH